MQANNTGGAHAVESKYTPEEVDTIVGLVDKLEALFDGQSHALMIEAVACYVVEQAFSIPGGLADRLYQLGTLKKAFREATQAAGEFNSRAAQATMSRAELDEEALKSIAFLREKGMPSGLVQTLESIFRG